MAGTTGNQYCAQSLLACSWNAELAYSMGETFAQEAIAMDIAALYAPAMNIHRSPFSGRNYEYYSEDGYHSGKLAAAEVQGIQSQGVTPYCKHYAVNDQESNRDSGGLLTWANEQAMREIYLKGFEPAGNDPILALMNFTAVGEETTGTASGRQALRAATHNILYAAANSVGQEVSVIPVPYWLYIGVGVADVSLLALCAVYFVRRHSRMKAWKAAQAQNK